MGRHLCNISVSAGTDPGLGMHVFMYNFAWGGWGRCDSLSLLMAAQKKLPLHSLGARGSGTGPKERDALHNPGP